MGSCRAGGDGTATETSLSQIKTNFESNLELALKDYNMTADRHSEAVDTIQSTVRAQAGTACLPTAGNAPLSPGGPLAPLWHQRPCLWNFPDAG